MVHNPTCGCPNCFPINYPNRVNPHTQRSVHSHRSKQPERHSLPKWNWHENYTFSTKCWWCGEAVYFHRNNNGGCVLFESLGKPWPIHSCWEQHKSQQQEAILEITNIRKKQLKTTTSKDLSFKNNKVEQKACLEGFIVGFESQQKILPNPKSLSNPDSHLRYLVFESVNGDIIKVLAPESLKQEIEKFSYVFIDIETHKKKTQSVLCVIRITEKAINSEQKHVLEIDFDYESFMVLQWSYQSKKT
ncbi:MAG: hypothetical protein AB2708_20455 [Candidatus Thiodiazotropha taylori]